MQAYPHMYQQTPPRGFTLVETLVAVAVLMLAIMGPITMAAEGLRNSFIARDQIVAFYLAQEAIEMVRYQRDSNALAGADWLNNLNACLGANCGVEIANLPTASFSGCASLNNCRIYYNAAASGRAKYSHTATGGTVTPFTRTLQITGSGSVERDVVVTVTWSTPVGDRTITVRTRVFNQYDNL